MSLLLLPYMYHLPFMFQLTFNFHAKHDTNRIHLSIYGTCNCKQKLQEQRASVGEVMR
jgi:hypothetical protein